MDVSKRQQIVNELIGPDPSLLKAKEEAEAALAKTVEKETNLQAKIARLEAKVEEKIITAAMS